MLIWKDGETRARERLGAVIVMQRPGMTLIFAAVTTSSRYAKSAVIPRAEILWFFVDSKPERQFPRQKPFNPKGLMMFALRNKNH